MNKIPEGFVPYKRTAVFTEESIPKGLLKDHTVKEDCYAKICIIEGELDYTITEPEISTYRLNKNLPGIIEPQIKHHIKAVNKVRFFVEFYRSEEN